MSLRDVDVDVTLLSMEHAETAGLPSHLLAEYPAMTLVILQEDCRVAYIENMIPHRSPISDVSPNGIMSALRLADSYASEIDRANAGRRPH